MERNISIIDMKRHHCGMMSRKIRLEQIHPSFDEQGGIHRLIVNHFNKSDYGRSIFFGDEIVAMGGVQKGFLKCESFAWLSISRNLKNLKSSIALSVIREIKRIIKNENKLISIINISDETSVKFAKFLGFERVNNEENNSDFVIMQIKK